MLTLLNHTKLFDPDLNKEIGSYSLRTSQIRDQSIDSMNAKSSSPSEILKIFNVLLFWNVSSCQEYSI